MSETTRLPHVAQACPNYEKMMEQALEIATLKAQVEPMKTDIGDIKQALTDQRKMVFVTAVSAIGALMMLIVQFLSNVKV